MAPPESAWRVVVLWVQRLSAGREEVKLSALGQLLKLWWGAAVLRSSSEHTGHETGIAAVCVCVCVDCESTVPGQHLSQHQHPSIPTWEQVPLLGEHHGGARWEGGGCHHAEPGGQDG